MHVGAARSLRGGEVQQLLLMEGLRGLGHTVCHVGRSGGQIGIRAAAAGIECIALPPSAEFVPLGGLVLSRMARVWRADVLHLHDPRALALGCRAASHFRPRCVVASRRVDFPVRNAGNYTHNVDRVIAVSSAVADVLVDCGVPAGRIDVVHSALDPSHAGGTSARAEICARYGWGEDPFLIGALAALAEHKGLRYLIEAAPAVLAARPDARFLIVGEGELRAELTALISRLGVEEQVRLFGFTDRVADVVAGFDVCVLPSISGEGSPGAVKEAMAAGVAVLGAESGGIPEVVGDAGLLVPPADAPAIAEALLRLASDGTLRTSLAAKGAARAASLFSPEAMVAGTLCIYYHILGA